MYWESGRFGWLHNSIKSTQTTVKDGLYLPLSREVVNLSNGLEMNKCSL